VIWSALHATAISGLETAINAALKYDPATQRDLESLDQQILLVDCSLPPLRIAIEPCQDRVILHSNWQAEAAVTISGSLVALASMAVNSRDSSSFADSNVQLSGNLETLRKLNDILSHLDVDWEAALADLVGDVPAHIVGETLRKSAQYAGENMQRATSAVVEVAQEELRLTPSRSEYQKFANNVRQLASDTDRLIAKAEKLRAKIAQSVAGNSI